MDEPTQNIVLLSIDSLRADHCGYLGDTRGLTPTLDRMADEGMAFETAIAPGPQTFSSMPAVFTGYHRPRERMESYPGETHWQRRLAALRTHLSRYVSLPERLGELGYTTVGISPNPWTSRAAGFDRGFDLFLDFSGESRNVTLRGIADRLPGVDATPKWVKLVLDLLSKESFFTPWTDIDREFQEIREQLEEPYFLWIFLLDTHFPFIPERSHLEEQSLFGIYTSNIRAESVMRGNSDSLAPSTRESLRRSYRDSIRSVDRFLETFLGELAPDDPAVILHSDHGESFGERELYGHHHRQLFEENIHVPLVVANLGEQQSVSAPVSLARIPDLALSIARMGTVDPLDIGQEYVIATSEARTNRAIRWNRFKYVESSDGVSMYDLRSDPGEETDVIDQYPDLVRDARQALGQFETQTTETNRIGLASQRAAVDSSLSFTGRRGENR